jgi:hypothetical protein
MAEASDEAIPYAAVEVERVGIDADVTDARIERTVSHFMASS